MAYNKQKLSGLNIMESFCSLKRKDVINVCDGMRLGNVTDLEFDARTGRILRLIVSGEPCYFGIIGRCTKVVVPWECIVKTGDDILLVNVDKQDMFLKGKC